MCGSLTHEVEHQRMVHFSGISIYTHVLKFLPFNKKMRLSCETYVLTKAKMLGIIIVAAGCFTCLEKYKKYLVENCNSL